MRTLMQLGEAALAALEGMPSWLRLTLAAAVALAAVVAAFRRWEIRLVMVVAGLALGTLGAKPLEPLHEIFRQMVNPSFVIPICTALGFAEACKAAGCDRELVRLLLKPARRGAALLIPAVAALGFVVNIPVVSQTGTAVAVGSVAAPLLLSAGVPPVAAAAALALGASIGGELLNPAGTEYGAIEVATAKLPPEQAASRAKLLQRNWPAALVQGAVAIAAAWWLSRGRGATKEAEPDPAPINLSLALVPLLPLALLFLTAKGFGLFPLPEDWFSTEAERKANPHAGDPRWIGTAMFVGAAAAMLAGWRARTAGPAAAARGFFAGAGHAYGEVVTLIVAASAFAAGVKAVGLAAALGPLAKAAPGMVLPLAALATALFALLCGSGIAASQGLFPIFLGSALEAGVAPTTLGAAMTAAGAAGRTASPVAAVNLLAAKLTGVEPGEIARRNAVPILLGALAGLAMAFRP